MFKPTQIYLPKIILRDVQTDSNLPAKDPLLSYMPELSSDSNGIQKNVAQSLDTKL